MLLPKDVRIKQQSLPARIAAWKLNSKAMAIVFGNTIHLHGVSAETFVADTKWLKHELKHVEQYRQHGYIRFLYKYLLEWISHGYYQNRFEVEARAAEME